MKEIREELDSISLKVCRLEDLGELLGDYFYNNLVEKKHSKGDTLVTLLIEKVQDLDSNISNLYKKTIEVEKEGEANGN